MKLRLVDKIFDFSKWRFINTRKVISFEEFSVLKIWGRKGSFPESLILQVAIESASLLVSVSSEFEKICLLEKVEDIQYISSTVPGDILTTNVNIRSCCNGHYECDFNTLAGRKQIAKGTFGVVEIPLTSCYDKESYVLIWREICDQAS